MWLRYCRGVDRGDRELLRAAYHAGANDDHGMFKGKGSDFADWIVEAILRTAPDAVCIRAPVRLDRRGDCGRGGA